MGDDVRARLGEVLAAHSARLGWSGVDSWNAECLGCGWLAHGTVAGGVAAKDAFNAHLADALALTARAAAPDGLRVALEGWIDDQRQLLPDARTPVAHGKAELLRDLHTFLAAHPAPGGGACPASGPVTGR